MDIEKLFKEFVEKEWHDGHEPQGGYDHYDEDEEVEEARTYLDRKDEKKKKGFTPQSQKKKRWGSGGYGKGEEVEESEEDEAYGGTKKWKKGQKKMKKAGIELHKKDRFSGYVEKVEEVEESQIGTGDQESRALIATKARWEIKKALKSGKKQSQAWWNKQVKLADIDANDKPAAVLQALSKEEIEEGIKDLPPHLQKLIKKIEKKQKDWNKQNPDAKIQTLVYNPETGKPDIIVKETMKLEDTVKQVVMGEHKGNKPHKHPHEDEVKKEDSDKDEPGTQGDMAAYQKKRKAVAKKFGVSSCSQLDGAKKKACYSALDKAHVADHEEQVELEKMRKEETQKTFSKMFSHIKSLIQGK